MRHHRFWTPLSRSLFAFLLAGGLFSAPGCDDSITGSEDRVDLDPFKVMAGNATCADTRNRLYLVDDAKVFLDQVGTCADAGFAQRLYASTTDSVLAERYETIAGVITQYQDESYRVLFDTMIANPDQPDLGLGSGHTVESVAF